MKRLAQTVLEIVALLALAAGLAFASNTLRRDGLQFGKNYFETPDHSEDGPPYHVVTFEEVLAIIEDPLYEAGVYMLIDARNDDQFAEGWIPGAWRLDPYHLELYVDELLDVVLSAERIILYCEGGDCEDSIYAGRELLNLGVERERISLYEGGMEDWRANDGPIDTGDAE